MTDTPNSAPAFTGSVPDLYERHLGPMFFVPYARDLAGRVRVPADGRILELACGTGILTRELLRAMPAGATLTSTDLSDPMLDVARRVVHDRRVEFRQADAMALPFDAESFDAVVSQFGVMFFPDKSAAAGQVRRVLRPRGIYLFNVWGTQAENPLSRTAQNVIEESFPENPPTFYQVPWGYADRRQIEADLGRGGFRDVQIETVDLTARSVSAEHAAIGLVEGSPMAGAIKERGGVSVDEVRRRMTDALAREHGTGEIAVPMRAYVVAAS